MKKALSIILIAIMLFCIVPTTVFAATEIKIVTVKDILEPLDGFKPDLSGTPGEASKYTVKKVEWTEYDDGMEWQRDLTADNTFVKGNYYFVFITLEAKEGYVFSDNITATVNGAQANKYAPRDNGKTIQIYYCFALCKKNIARVDLTIVNPVVGKTPTFAKVNTDEYESKNKSGISNQTNGVSWTNQSSGVNLTVSNPFKENTKYTVKYNLVAKENCWFNGTKYYVNGKQVSVISSNAGMTEVVVGLTDLIPGDGKKLIDAVELTITAPRHGEKPNYTKIDGTGYYSDNGLNGTSTKIYKNGIAFYKSASSYISPGTTETFKGGTEYIVKVSLAPKDGYKFSSSVNATINGKTATVEKFDDGSINVSMKITALNKEQKQSESDMKNDDTGTTTSGNVTSNYTQNSNDDTTDTSNQTDSTTDIGDETIESNDYVTTKDVLTNKQNEQKENDFMIWMILGIAVVVVSGATIAILALKKKKMSNFEE